MRRDRDEREARLREVVVDAHDAALVVEAVEQRRKVVAVARDALRRVVVSSLLDLFRVLLDFLDQSDFTLIRQEVELRCLAERELCLLRLAEDAADAGVRILDVVDRIVVRLLLGEVEPYGPYFRTSL